MNVLLAEAAPAHHVFSEVSGLYQPYLVQLSDSSLSCLVIIQRNGRAVLC